MCTIYEDFIEFINYIKIYGFDSGILNKNFPMDILESTYTLVYLINGFLVIFTCIAIGQRFNKNRNIISTCLFVGYFIITTIAKTSIMLSDFYIYSPSYGIHPLLFTTIAIIFKLIMCVIYYLILHNSLDKHLNLE